MKKEKNERFTHHCVIADNNLIIDSLVIYKHNDNYMLENSSLRDIEPNEIIKTGRIKLDESDNENEITDLLIMHCDRIINLWKNRKNENFSIPTIAKDFNLDLDKIKYFPIDKKELIINFLKTL